MLKTVSMDDQEFTLEINALESLEDTFSILDLAERDAKRARAAIILLVNFLELLLKIYIASKDPSRLRLISSKIKDTIPLSVSTNVIKELGFNLDLNFGEC